MARKNDSKPFQSEGGYTQCSWTSAGIQCRFPGSMSSNLGGTGPWFCRWHFDCSDPVYGQQVVDESKGYRQKTDQEKAKERYEQALANLDKYGLAKLPDESNAEWVERMRQFVRRGFRRFADRQQRERKAA